MTRTPADNAIVTQPQYWAGKPVTKPVPRSESAHSWSVGRLLLALFSVIWFTISLPFRLTFRIIAWLGRLTAVLLGFVLMVVGIALWAGPLFFIGIPLFVVGLVLTLRCLD